MNRKRIILMIVILPSIVCAQRSLDHQMNSKVTVNYHDYIVYAEVKTSGSKPRAKDQSYYYWYNANDIKKTRGGYDGKLLHGKYTEFYADKDLKSKGKFRNGRKQGKWKTWYPGGQIKEVIKWKRKGKIGKFKNYDEGGDLIKTGVYKYERYHGKVKLVTPQGETIRYFKNGQEIRQDTSHNRKQSRLRKFFRKKEKVRGDSVLNNKTLKGDSVQQKKTGKRRSRAEKQKVKDEQGASSISRPEEGSERKEDAQPDTVSKSPSKRKEKKNKIRKEKQEPQ